MCLSLSVYLCVPNCVFIIVCVSKLMYLIVYVLMCDAATQQLGGLCLRWAAERQDKTDEFV